MYTSYLFFTYCDHRVFCIDWEMANVFSQFNTFLVKTFKLIFEFPLYCCNGYLIVNKNEAKKAFGN